MGLQKGDDRALALAVLFEVVSKDCQEISGLLQQLYKGTVSAKEKSSVLGKRTRRKNTKVYWTHAELDKIEAFLKKHIMDGGNSENVDLDKICAAVPTRSKKDVTKQLDVYKRATTNNFRDLSFFKAAPVKVKPEPVDDMDVEAPVKSSTPAKKKRKSSTSAAPATSAASTPKPATLTKKKSRKSSGAASQEEAPTP